uniref:Uncharacterized protein n=1 Tax=Arundo donax TaxID=35708 RepID=A0A0A9BE10_ARUDO
MAFRKLSIPLFFDIIAALNCLSQSQSDKNVT